MKLWNNDDTLAEVVWFRVPDDTKWVPMPHCYGSRIWSDPKEHTAVGEQYPYLLPGECPDEFDLYYNGHNPASYNGKRHCGADEAWLHGGRHGVDPAILTGTNGDAGCCGVVRYDGGDGEGDGGHPPVYSAFGQFAQGAGVFTLSREGAPFADGFIVMYTFTGNDIEILSGDWAPSFFATTGGVNARNVLGWYASGQDRTSGNTVTLRCNTGGYIYPLLFAWQGAGPVSLGVFTSGTSSSGPPVVLPPTTPMPEPIPHVSDVFVICNVGPVTDLAGTAPWGANYWGPGCPGEQGTVQRNEWHCRTPPPAAQPQRPTICLVPIGFDEAQGAVAIAFKGAPETTFCVNFPGHRIMDTEGGEGNGGTPTMTHTNILNTSGGEGNGGESTFPTDSFFTTSGGEGDNGTSTFVFSPPGCTPPTILAASGAAWSFAASHSVSAPAGLAGGELMYAWQWNTSAGTPAAPSGWTVVERVTAPSGGQLSLYSHRYVPGEVAYTFNSPVGFFDFELVLIEATSGNGIDNTGTGTATGTGTSATATGFTSTSSCFLAVMPVADANGGTITTPSGMAVAGTVSDMFGNALTVFKQTIASGGAVGTKTAGFASSCNWSTNLRGIVP